jgi:hypothetical protein
MLPYCETITLLDKSDANLRRLRQRIRYLPRSRDPFWAKLRERWPYQAVEDPRRGLAHRVVLERSSATLSSPRYR